MRLGYSRNVYRRERFSESQKSHYRGEPNKVYSLLKTKKKTSYSINYNLKTRVHSRKQKRFCSVRIFIFKYSEVITFYFTVWLSSGASLEYSTVPFLPVDPDLSSMRNQGRQKLARLSPGEFSALILDLLHDADRRQLFISKYNHCLFVFLIIKR